MYKYIPSRHFLEGFFIHLLNLREGKKVGIYCKIELGDLEKDMRLKWRGSQNEEIINDVDNFGNSFIRVS